MNLRGFACTYETADDSQSTPKSSTPQPTGTSDTKSAGASDDGTSLSPLCDERQSTMATRLSDWKGWTCALAAVRSKTANTQITCVLRNGGVMIWADQKGRAGKQYQRTTGRQRAGLHDYPLDFDTKKCCLEEGLVRISTTKRKKERVDVDH